MSKRETQLRGSLLQAKNTQRDIREFFYSLGKDWEHIVSQADIDKAWEVITIFQSAQFILEEMIQDELAQDKNQPGLPF